MTEIMEFNGPDGFERMMAFMATQTDLANAHLAPEQAAINPGDYWVRFDHMPDDLLIVGKIFTLDEIVHGEMACYTSDEDLQDEGYANRDDAEGQIRRRFEENFARGYMFGTAYSPAEPRGELGDTHKANMWPISKQTFDALRAADWSVDNLSAIDAHNLGTLYGAWLAHEMRKARTITEGTQQ